jgi:hypothetical protein
MKTILRLATSCVALVLLVPPLTAQHPVAFVDVTVIPMDRERVLERHTVIVRDGRIASVEPSSRARVPSNALRVNGRGKYLMPGLAEMHAHIPGAQAPEQLVRDIFALYIANGITTIRGMLGAPNQLTLRSQTASGALLGPTIFVGAPSLNGNSAADPATAARLVREHKAAGYDFLKLHPGIPLASYDSIVAAARSVGITFAGHIAAAVGLEHTLASRQSTIDHLDGYLEASVPPHVHARIVSNQATLGELAEAVDPTRLQWWAGETRKAGTWNVPTAFLWESFFSSETPEAMAARPEMRYASAQWLTGWSNQKRNRMQQDQQQGVTPAHARRFLELRRTLLKALADSGAGILMGTDSPQMFNVPGFALHHEQRGAVRRTGSEAGRPLRHGRGRQSRRSRPARRESAQRYPQRREARGRDGAWPLAAGTRARPGAGGHRGTEQVVSARRCARGAPEVAHDPSARTHRLGVAAPTIAMMLSRRPREDSLSHH